jgi:hypothetical protein
MLVPKRQALRQGALRGKPLARDTDQVHFYNLRNNSLMIFSLLWAFTGASIRTLSTSSVWARRGASRMALRRPQRMELPAPQRRELCRTTSPHHLLVLSERHLQWWFPAAQANPRRNPVQETLPPVLASARVARLPELLDLPLGLLRRGIREQPVSAQHQRRFYPRSAVFRRPRPPQSFPSCPVQHLRVVRVEQQQQLVLGARALRRP